jgi:chemotaxis signal transduction protein
MKKSQKEWGSKLGLSLEAMTLAAQKADQRIDLVSILLFEVGGNRFGLGIEHTEGVVDCPKITPVPSAPDGIIGVASVRGRMTLVMDLSMGTVPRDGRNRLILLKNETQLGLLSDRIQGVMAVEPRRISKSRSAKRESSTESESGWPAAAYFKEAGSEVLIIDVDRLVEP